MPQTRHKRTGMGQERFTPSLRPSGGAASILRAGSAPERGVEDQVWGLCIKATHLGGK